MSLETRKKGIVFTRKLPRPKSALAVLLDQSKLHARQNKYYDVQEVTEQQDNEASSDKHDSQLLSRVQFEATDRSVADEFQRKIFELEEICEETVHRENRIRRNIERNSSCNEAFLDDSCAHDHSCISESWSHHEGNDLGITDSGMTEGAHEHDWAVVGDETRQLSVTQLVNKFEVLSSASGSQGSVIKTRATVMPPKGTQSASNCHPDRVAVPHSMNPFLDCKESKETEKTIGVVKRHEEARLRNNLSDGVVLQNGNEFFYSTLV